MSEIPNPQSAQPTYYPVPQNSDDEIDLRELFSVIWQGKWWIILSAIIFGIIGGIYAVEQPNIYESSVLIAPAENNNTTSIMANLASQYSGLASLAGINLGNSVAGKGVYDLQVLQSRKFIGDFINRHHLKPLLMATKGWDKKTEKFEYNTKLYNPQTKQWLIDDDGKSLEPSYFKSVNYFIKKILDIEINEKIRMATISIQFYSPTVAQQWATWLVDDLNEDRREQDMTEAQNNMKYLEQQLHQTSLADNRTMLYQLIEQQTKTLMLAKVRKEYSFRTVDPALVAERHVKPKRSLFVIVAFALGGLLGIIFVVYLKFIKNN
ncbi:Wzz/FepE/Etk N-terminal domain-containing protein [Celerinatantimonas sp. YJH-8]|uniref:Wzz/FepE/Etk N-terminal domain-containing protein n=1 Tax=Celerinatantimonas sp. YJH-8 TaxID=3228714 RepID=UPI0038BFCF9C